MGRQAVEAPGTASIAPGSDQLARRVLAMVDSPVAWLGKRVRIHRLETDGDEEWGEVMDRLAAMNGLQMDFENEGSVILQWKLGRHQSGIEGGRHLPPLTGQHFETLGSLRSGASDQNLQNFQRSQ